LPQPATGDPDEWQRWQGWRREAVIGQAVLSQPNLVFLTPDRLSGSWATGNPFWHPSHTPDWPMRMPSQQQQGSILLNSVSAEKFSGNFRRK
jgi:hypothetical protein